jgi:hypothetical protein
LYALIFAIVPVSFPSDSRLSAHAGRALDLIEPSCRDASATVNPSIEGAAFLFYIFTA